MLDKNPLSMKKPSIHRAGAKNVCHHKLMSILQKSRKKFMFMMRRELLHFAMNAPFDVDR